jgi:hypothetical protein
MVNTHGGPHAHSGVSVGLILEISVMCIISITPNPYTRCCPYKQTCQFLFGFKLNYIAIFQVTLFVFVLFYSEPIQFMSYGAETGKMILANCGCYKQATTWVKTISPAGAKRCI